MTKSFDQLRKRDDSEAPNFEGHEGRECGEHRTVGAHRAWCYNCTEWCYPSMPCKGCERPVLMAVIEAARALEESDHYAVDRLYWKGVTRSSLHRLHAALEKVGPE